VAGVDIVDDPAQGAQAGDRVLAPAAGEELCFQVVPPGDVTTGAGLTTTATFTFQAEQTAYNP
jgi:hypothetical protein